MNKKITLSAERDKWHAGWMEAEARREERARALDEVSEQWAAAVYGMTENGVAALNAKAARDRHPEITAFSEWLSNAAIRAEAGD